MGEIPDLAKKMKKLREKLRKEEPEVFEKGEVGILEGSGKKRKKKRNRRKE
jgi:hypothetical protein